MPELPSLTELNLGHCDMLTNLDGMPALPALTSLTLRECDSLSSLAGMPQLPMLRMLDLRECTNLKSLDGAPELPGLETVYLTSEQTELIELFLNQAQVDIVVKVPEPAEDDE